MRNTNKAKMRKTTNKTTSTNQFHHVSSASASTLSNKSLQLSLASGLLGSQFSNSATIMMRRLYVKVHRYLAPEKKGRMRVRMKERGREQFMIPMLQLTPKPNRNELGQNEESCKEHLWYEQDRHNFLSHRRVFQGSTQENCQRSRSHCQDVGRQVECCEVRLERNHETRTGKE